MKDINYTITLGELTDVCRYFPVDLPVYFDNGQHPDYIDSWRGIYSELALNHSSEGEPMACGDFVSMLEEADGKTFTGYKGGDYKMDGNTDVWMDNYGEYTSMTISGARIMDNRVVLCTIREDS